MTSPDAAPRQTPVTAKDPAPSAVPGSAPLVIVIMGVAGSGKTTVGEALAQALGWGFRDADEFHPVTNIAKMTAGIPLTDADRAPWLAAIRAHIGAALAAGRGAVVTCSALKKRYRQALIPHGDDRVKLVHLHGEFGLIRDRLRQRQGHFMKPEMLESQFEALEPPADALQLDIDQSVPEQVAAIRRAFNL